MFLFPVNPVYIGAEITSSCLRLVALQKKGKRWKVLFLKEIEKKEAFDLPVNFLEKSSSCSALSSEDVLFRSLSFPLKKQKEILKAALFQLEPLIPYPLDKAVVHIQQTKNDSLLSCFVARKDHVQHHLDLLKTWNIQPDQVSCVPFALTKFFSTLNLGPLPYAVVHIGEKIVSCLLIEKETLIATRAFDLQLNLPIEIQKTLLSFTASQKQKPFESILFIGGDSSLWEKVQKATDKKILLPSSACFSLSQEELSRFSVAIGAALSQKGPNFRQKEFSSPLFWKKLKKPLLNYFACILTLTCAICAFGKLSLIQKEKNIAQLVSLVIPQQKTPHEYLQSIRAVEKEIQEKPNTYPLYPQVPKVKDLLLWLSNHLMDNEAPLVNVEGFRYVMENRPTPAQKKGKYTVKAVLEFSTRNPSFARRAHEILLTPNPFVDLGREVEMTQSRGKYLMTFYLKDRTQYF